MKRRHLIIYLVFLIILLLGVGNYIHMIKVKKAIDYLSISNIFKNQSFTIHIEVDKKVNPSG